ncbi:MAG: FadR/GntR family transcriptional regulator [Janthinobacterium lividum]
MAVQQKAFQPVKTTRVFEAVCEQIRQRLAAGTLSPGDKLPSERDLAIEFGVSRPAVREALRTLEMSGIVHIQKGTKGGASIRGGDQSMLTQSLNDLVALGRISMDGITEARALIQQAIVRLACTRGTEADFDAIQHNIERIVELTTLGDITTRAEEAIRFFRLIALATHNDALVLLVDSLNAVIGHVVRTASPPVLPQLTTARWQLLACLRARDTEGAAREIATYLDIVDQEIVQGALRRESKLAAGAVPADG